MYSEVNVPKNAFSNYNAVLLSHKEEYTPVISKKIEEIKET